MQAPHCPYFPVVRGFLYGSYAVYAVVRVSVPAANDAVVLIAIGCNMILRIMPSPVVLAFNAVAPLVVNVKVSVATVAATSNVGLNEPADKVGRVPPNFVVTTRASGPPPVPVKLYP